MYDGLIYALEKIKNSDKKGFLAKLQYYIPNNEKIDEFYVATLHRPENVDDISKVKSIMDGFESLDLPVIFAVHPITILKVKEIVKEKQHANIHFVKPLGYLDMIYFASNARKIITDSGGLHKEAFLIKKPAVVVLRSSAWNETLDGNCNVLAKPDDNDIVNKLYNTKIDFSKYNVQHYGNGTASKQIAEILSKYACDNR